jgi:hypothetical protein
LVVPSGNCRSRKRRRGAGEEVSSYWSDIV